MPPATIEPGRVILQTTHGWVASCIRFGEECDHLPHEYNHVIVSHHVDSKGTCWGIEGRPGGVGWVDLTHALSAPNVLINAEQPLTSDQGEAVAKAMEALIGTQYAWLDGIARDVARDIDHLWLPREEWGPGVPGHVVCSSAADFAYEKVGLASPAPDRACQPSDWELFINQRLW